MSSAVSRTRGPRRTTPAGHIVVYDRAVNRVAPSGVTKVESYIVYKKWLNTRRVAATQSVLRWRCTTPQSSHVEVREVNVIRGKEKIAVDVSKVRDLPAPQSAIYWKDRIKTLQLPAASRRTTGSRSASS